MYATSNKFDISNKFDYKISLNCSDGMGGIKPPTYSITGEGKPFLM